MARFVTRNYVYETGSMTDILGQLKWESLKKRRKDNRLILSLKVRKVEPGYRQMTLFPRLGVAGISTPWPFRSPQPVKMSISIVFPQTIIDWNDLPESLFSSSELPDDGVSKLTFLVRARA